MLGEATGQKRIISDDGCVKTGLAQTMGSWGIRSCAEGGCEINSRCYGSGLTVFQPM